MEAKQWMQTRDRVSRNHQILRNQVEALTALKEVMASVEWDGPTHQRARRLAIVVSEEIVECVSVLMRDSGLEIPTLAADKPEAEEHGTDDLPF